MFGRVKKHYHWVIALIAIIQMLIYGGAMNNFAEFHKIPITQEFDLSRTAFSVADSIRAIVGVASTFCSGYLIQRFGYRKTTSAALLVAAGAYVIFSTMHAYWMLIVGCAMMGVAHGLCFAASVSRLINAWFEKYRGTVLGLVTAATGLGSTVLGMIQAPLVENISWRASFVAVAGLQFAVALLVFIFVRNTPQSVGLTLYGEKPVQTEGTTQKTDAWSGFSMEFLRKRPSYYMLCACALLSCLCVLATQHNLVPYFQDCGMSVTRAGELYGIMMFALGILKLVMGVLCDAFGAKRVLILSHIACASGLIMVMFLPQTDIAMVTALIVYDFAIPMTTMMFPLVSADLFGNRSQTQYIGTIMAMTTAGNILSGILSDAIYDRMGSYQPVFWGFAAMAILMIPAYFLLYRMVKRDRKLESQSALQK